MASALVLIGQCWLDGLLMESPSGSCLSGTGWLEEDGLVLQISLDMRPAEVCFSSAWYYETGLVVARRKATIIFSTDACPKKFAIQAHPLQCNIAASTMLYAVSSD